jgi:2-polyprenyl-3-methyl-5-hydroxy-6-metoxy-1,4-benzoquinol methylase
MNRIKKVAQIIAELRVKSLLDVGCRDAILKKHIHTGMRYHGCDLFQNSDESVDIVGDIREIILPENEFEMVTAIDILEHLDDPYTIFSKLVKASSKYVVINLPNCYDLKSTIKFVVGGQLGGKYLFNTVNSPDRHRWIMNITEIENFYRSMAKRNNLELKIVYVFYGGGNKSILSKVSVMIRWILPKRYVVSSVIGIFEKKSL